MTDTEQLNGQQDPTLGMLRNDILAITTMLGNLEWTLMYQGLIGRLPTPALEQVASRLEAMHTMVKSRISQGE